MRTRTPAETTALLTRIELLVLALVAILPVVPYLAFFIGKGAPRHSVFADFALIEHEARHVWKGETLLGLGSRFGWHHPGPLYSYFIAPFLSLFGSTSSGLYVGTAALTAASVATPVVAARIASGRIHALAVLAVMIAWLAAFGNVAANPWNRTVITIPLVCYLALLALVARGSSGSAIPAAFFGAIVMETHVSTVTTVAASGFLAIVVLYVRARRRDGSWRGRLDRIERRNLAVAVGLLVLAISPMLIEQLTAARGSGNISKLIAFLLKREEPFKSLAVASKDFAQATAWMPDRILEGTLRTEGSPMVVRWSPVPAGLSRTEITIVAVHIVAVVAAFVVARRRRDTTSLALLSVGAVSSVLALSAIRAIAGEEHYSLLFWSTAPSTVSWMGVVSTFAGAASDWVERRKAPRMAMRVLAFAGAAAVIVTTIFQRDWLAANPAALVWGAEPREDLRAVLGTLHERLARDGSTPVIHLFGAWPIATAAVLELEKDGVDVRLSDADAWSFAGAKTKAGVERPYHVYFDSPDDPLRLVPCLELVAKSGRFAVYGSVEEPNPTSCEQQSWL